MKKKFKIYVYGSCHFTEQFHNDESVGIGGYGVVITVNGQSVEQLSGGFSATTNARMDITGILETVKWLDNSSEAVIYLANGYIVDALNKGWLDAWERKGYKKKKHADLWEKLRKLLKVKGLHLRFESAKDVKYNRDYQQAESLAKTMSGKRNLPLDIQPLGKGLFDLHESGQTENKVIEDDMPDQDSICVDASTIGNPGITEYRGVDTRTRHIIFQHKYPEATNNIGEFLAIVHALALYKKKNMPLKIIYSDSQNAISWVKQKKCKTKYQKTPANSCLFEDIERAVKWLEDNTYSTKILKWNTGAWGQIPADYGRK